MAKKKTPKRKKGEKLHEIDHIPKYSQQRRSPGGPRRRTDFSLFFCFSSSSISKAPLSQGLLLESSSGNNILSSVTTASLDETRGKRKEMLECPLVQCSQSQDKRQGSFSNIVEVPPVLEVESAASNAAFEQWSDRNVDKQRIDVVKTLEFTPYNSQNRETSDVCITPGSVVWAKMADQLWWPAEVLGERSSFVDSSNQGIDGRILIQFYGNRESAWVDPARDLSRFEDCFKERSCNPMEGFQDALREALHQKEHLRLSRQFTESPDGPNYSNQQDDSPDKCNSSSSSRTASDCRGRGKRERKPKVHFDDVIFPLKSARKVRRFRIMRFLGLAAPVGSPFNSPSL
ncbi:uncharacterized protein LOC132312978 [Cornus florida]|uniref:uncharacterized protein LOC132312978 n=1 Tax=Cornus florida TaxID=4283 RepID=UPI00289EDE6F|nr:uncharacterized protein LOC132312978 [Cornus florida]XP_059667550.1 uncharacterized protein LOC132312978 [Cornus florida]XP_059667551.1 uncharacterized protein LOC132312978 [Cornus florida]XP_059667552.1 uncharacterized protein LOC132312978 [Cornus florida]